MVILCTCSHLQFGITFDGLPFPGLLHFLLCLLHYSSLFSFSSLLCFFLLVICFYNFQCAMLQHFNVATFAIPLMIFFGEYGKGFGMSFFTIIGLELGLSYMNGENSTLLPYFFTTQPLEVEIFLAWQLLIFLFQLL